MSFCREGERKREREGEVKQIKNNEGNAAENRRERKVVEEIEVIKLPLG